MKRALPAIAAIVALLLAYAGGLDLAEDEAYYWVWSRSLAAGYFDHPPAIAWLIRVGTAVLGDTERGVRAVPILVGGATLALASLSSRDRLLAALALGTMPLFVLGGLLATPDVPLVAAWALGLWASLRERWWLVGLAAGLAMLSKYTGLLLLPLLVLAHPSELRRRGPWIAAAIALLVYLPNAWWNLSHDLVSWRFQLEHVSQEARRLDFLAAQAGLAGPPLFLALVAWWAVGWRGTIEERRCWWASFPVLVAGIVAGGEANWAAPAYVGAVVGIALRAEGRIHRAAWLGVGVGAVLSAVVLLHARHPLFDLSDDPTHRLIGGRTLGESIAAWGEPRVFTERYQEAALVHFYAGVPARTWPGAGRPSQYDLAPFEQPEGGLFVRTWQGDRPVPVEEEGFDHGEGNVVTAYAETTEETAFRPVARWQVFEFWPEGR